MKCVLLTTDTKHHRYFANRISRRIQTTIILEHGKANPWRSYWNWVHRHRSVWSLIDNPYIKLCHPRFQHLQDEFEDQFFHEAILPDFSGYSEMHEFYSVNDEVCVGLIRKLEPNLIVSFGTGLIKQGILQLNALKVNVHRGVLPKYRGLDSDLWAFYFRDFDNVGTTIHELEARFDTGRILCQGRIKIHADMKVYQMRYYTTVLAAEMVESIIEDLKGGNSIAGECQSEGGYFPFIPPLKWFVAIWRFNRYVKSVG